MVHPGGGRGVCVAHGGCAGALRGALRSEKASCLLRRVALPDGGREAHSLTHQAWTPAALRLRVRAQGYGQHLCVLRAQARSEEHTSELQSRQYLVCRLLLEKKK